MTPLETLREQLQNRIMGAIATDISDELKLEAILTACTTFADNLLEETAGEVEKGRDTRKPRDENERTAVTVCNQMVDRDIAIIRAKKSTKTDGVINEVISG